MARSRQERSIPYGSARLIWRKGFQLVAGVYFLVLILYSQWGLYLNPDKKAAEFFLNLPLWLDPLAMVSKIIASRGLFPLELLFLVTIILTLLFGRVWCGWFCPLGICQDWTALRRSKAKPKDLPGWWRQIKYGLLILILGLAVFNNLSLLVFDPLTIFYRSVNSALLPGINQVITILEKGLYRIGFLQEAVRGFDRMIRPFLLPLQPDLYRPGSPCGLVFLGILLFNFFHPRFYCRYLCPLGGLLGLLSKVSLIKPRVKNNCSSCGLCVSSCPSGAIQNEDELTIHSSECTMCMVCPEVCPSAAIEIKSGEMGLDWGAYDPGRRTALVSLAAVVVGVGSLNAGMRQNLNRPHALRPPGADEDHLLKKCLRCGECAAACPTNAIQLSVFDSGLEGFWTPVLVPRIGPCDYSCNACGRICPVGAIPELELNQKKTEVIGKAYINTDRCIAWADQRDCIVCEEMCPLPEKAIRLEERFVGDIHQGNKTVLLPVVDRSRCIGCGICENKCPLSGEAAIRIFVPPTSSSLFDFGEAY